MTPDDDRTSRPPQPISLEELMNKRKMEQEEFSRVRNKRESNV